MQGTATPKIPRMKQNSTMRLKFCSQGGLGLTFKNIFLQPVIIILVFFVPAEISILFEMLIFTQRANHYKNEENFNKKCRIIYYYSLKLPADKTQLIHYHQNEQVKVLRTLIIPHTEESKINQLSRKKARANALFKKTQTK